jgi:hypothetical protein
MGSKRNVKIRVRRLCISTDKLTQNSALRNGGISKEK